MSKYSEKTKAALNNANQGRLGVRLGQACIAAEIPVQVVAAWFKISRQAVYYWFTGITDIHEKHQPKAEEIIKILTLGVDQEVLPAANLAESIEIIKEAKQALTARM